MARTRGRQAIACSAAYALSRFRFPGRRSSLRAFMLSQMFPGVVTSIPIYVLLDHLGLLNRMAGLVLVYATTAIPFCVLMLKANFDRLVQGASEAAASTKLPDERTLATLAIAISCVGRRLVLGERTEEETEATLDVLPRGTQQVGFYSYGEISPYTAGTCDLHNQTMTLTTLSEAA